MLLHPCSLGNPQHRARGAKSEVASSPLPSPWPKKGRLGDPAHTAGTETPGAKSQVAASPLRSQGPNRRRKCYVILASSGIPNAKRREQNQKWLPHPCFFGAQKRAEMLCYPYLLGGPKNGGKVTSPLHSQGSPTPSAGSKIGSGPQQTGTKSEVATSPMHCWRPKRGRDCYVTPAFSGIPNAQCADPNHKWYPTKGNKMRSGRLTLSTSGLKRGRKRYVTLTFSGIPNAQHGEQNQKWLPHGCLLKGSKEVENATLPVHSQGSPTPNVRSKIKSGPQQKGTKSLPRPQRGWKWYVTPAFSGIHTTKRVEQNQKWLPHPCLLRGPTYGGNATSPLHPRGSPTPSAESKNRSGCLTRGFYGAQKRAEMLCHPYPLRCPKKGGKAGSPLHSHGSPTPSAGSKIGSGPQQRAAILEVATSPMHY